MKVSEYLRRGKAHALDTRRNPLAGGVVTYMVNESETLVQKVVSQILKDAKKALGSIQAHYKEAKAGEKALTKSLRASVKNANKAVETAAKAKLNAHLDKLSSEYPPEVIAAAKKDGLGLWDADIELRNFLADRLERMGLSSELVSVSRWR